MKRINPYTRLLREIREFISNLQYRHKKVMWTYSKDNLNERWPLTQLYERVAAAKQLGYEVHLSADDEGLKVIYIKEIPHIPWSWK